MIGRVNMIFFSSQPPSRPWVEQKYEHAASMLYPNKSCTPMALLPQNWYIGAGTANGEMNISYVP